MATRADLQLFTTAMADVVAVAHGRLVEAWAGFDGTEDIADVSEAMQTLMVGLTEQYGAIAASAAADFYDTLRSQSNQAKAFAALMGTPAPTDQVAASTRWALGPLVHGDRDQALRNLAQVAQKLILQPARQGIADSVVRDPGRPRWARIPQGETCAFCLVMASRGPVYRSEKSAGGIFGEHADDYHNDCDCVPTPMWAGDTPPEDYDEGALYQRYKTARDASGSGRLKPILAKLRETEGLA